MTLKYFFKKVVDALDDHKVAYALAGGMVASIYRENERTTNDLDFLIVAETKTGEIASSIIKKFKLTPHLVRKAELEGGPMFAIKRKNTAPYIVAGRPEKGGQNIGLDFILPSMPWFAEAIKRAQFNKIDFGFKAIPCLTKEDLIISKLYSLKNDQKRFNDMDDLSSIFRASHEIDIPYICGQMQKLQLQVPESLKEIVPKPLLLTSKKILREFRKTKAPTK